MRFPQLLPVLAAPALALALTLVATPAGAQTHVVRDAARDVVSQDVDADAHPTRPEPTRDEGDALSMTATHGAKAVRIKVRLARLTPRSAEAVVHVFDLRTDKGRAELTVYVDGRRTQGERMWSVRGRDRTCAGLRSRVDYGAETVRVVIPRRCLSNPRWVRVGAGTGMFQDELLYADDVSVDGRVGDGLALGPRIRRG